jgi:tetratricopeptide (TPR) repeat protein
MPAPLHETLDERTLAAGMELYDCGLHRQALALLEPFGPLRQFTGTRSRLFAGRVAMNLGAAGLGRTLHLRAWRADRANLAAQCYWVSSRFERGGPLAAWRAVRKLGSPPASGADADHRNYFFTLRARVAWSFRDFEEAEAEFRLAEAAAPNLPWTLTERAHFLEAQDRYDDALATARRALELRPWYRPGVQSLAHFLQIFDRDDEALELLRQAAARMENLPVLSQLATLELDLELWRPASETLDRIAALSPILEEEGRNWLRVSKARVAHGCADWKSAAAFAREVKDDAFWQRFAERAEREDSPRRRVQLPVKFVRQYHMTCAPATLSALSHFWGQPAEHLEVAEEICYDGTPAHSERHWAESHGWTTREFTVTLPAAKALLDRGIPFTVTTTEATSGHLQACIGYDELRETLIIRDPFHYFAAEVVADPFLKRYAAHGPRGLALVPAARAERFDGLDLPDAPLHDRLYELNRALHGHDRTAAERALNDLAAHAPDHRLTLTGRRALASYDANTPAILAAIEGLLAQYPEDANLRLTKLSCLRELGRRDERLGYLRQLAEPRACEPVFWQALADELRADARQHVEARRWVERALRFRLDGYCLSTLADLLWSGQQFDEALAMYRRAACLDDKREPSARTYFLAARARKQTDAALRLLHGRVERLGAHSGGPACTLFECYEILDRTAEGLAALEAALRQRPEDGELLLFCANARARHGHAAEAAKLLDAVGGNVRRGALDRALAEAALAAGDRRKALDLWHEVLALEPLAMDAHENVARLLGELEGRPAALRHLAAVRERFPHHYGLHRLSIAWLRQESPQATEPVCRQLVAIHPADAWARRELAVTLAEAERPEDALVEADEAVRLEPENSWGWSLRAQLHQRLGHPAAARADFEQSLRAAVDTPPAIHGLVGLAPTLAERKQALAFVESELVRQVVFGDGLAAFRLEANQHLDAAAALHSLRTALRERPDLFPAWSAVVSQLTDMQQLDEALSLAEQATERFPLLATAWLDLARVRRARLDVPGEIEALQHAADTAPHWAEPCWRLGHAHERAGDFAAARRAFEQGAARQPFVAASHGLLAARLWQEGEKEPALSRFKQALDMDPGYEWAWERFVEANKQLGRPQAAEDLARELTDRLPGQPRPWVMLARARLAEDRLDEALTALDRAVQFHPRFADAHELRATILAHQQRWAEALEACRPAAFGSAVPVELRGRAAWIEDRSGHHRTALEQMRALLEENPGYIWGWQQLADWCYRANDLDGAVHAATRVARLQPFDATPLGYRAELKFQRNDRAGAKEDLARAVKTDPSYFFAASSLFALQLEDNDFDDALTTLDVVRKHHGPDETLMREVRLLATFLQNESARSRAVWRAYPAPAEAAKDALKKLCLSPTAHPEQLGAALSALLEAQRYRLVDETLGEVVRHDTVNPHVGALWTERRWKHGKRSCDREMKELIHRGEPGRRALIRLLEHLADAKAGLRFRWLVRKHRAWLREHPLGWTAVAGGYNQLGASQAVVAWCDGWRTRSPLRMADLLHLKIALSNLGRDAEALEVVRVAEGLPPDHTTAIFKLHSALGFALAGATDEARERLTLVGPDGLSEYYTLLKALVDAVVRVQSAAPSGRRQAFAEAHDEVRVAFLKFSLPKCDGALRSLYRRCFRRMGQDAGVRWKVWRECWRTVAF